MEVSPLVWVQRALEAVDGRDLTKLRDGGFAREIVHPDAEFDFGPVALPDEEVWRGREAFIAGWVRWLAQWDDYRASGFNYELHADGQVLLDTQVQARGRGSGVPVSTNTSQIWTVRDEKIRAIHVYATRADALEALSRAARGGADAPRTPPAP